MCASSPRPVEGAVFTEGKEPERFILDGQQRADRTFSIDPQQPTGSDLRSSRQGDQEVVLHAMSTALDSKTEREESIWGLPEDKTIKNFRGEIYR